MMSPYPGRVHDVIDVGIPRPRLDAVTIRTSEDFIEVRGRVWQLLQAANRSGGGQAPELQGQVG
jgi:ABC-type nitrate/sulfonate/bicarbonate transport system ATPase subunit